LQIANMKNRKIFWSRWKRHQVIQKFLFR